MTEVRQFKLTGPLQTMELVAQRQALQVKLSLLCLLLLLPPLQLPQMPIPPTPPPLFKGVFELDESPKSKAVPGKFKQASAAHSSLPVIQQIGQPPFIHHRRYYHIVKAAPF